LLSFCKYHSFLSHFQFHCRQYDECEFLNLYAVHFFGHFNLAFLLRLLIIRFWHYHIIHDGASTIQWAQLNLSVGSSIDFFHHLKFYFPILILSIPFWHLTGLVFSEYLLSGGVPRIKEVNDEEPLFPGLPFVNLNTYTVSEVFVLGLVISEL